MSIPGTPARDRASLLAWTPVHGLAALNAPTNPRDLNDTIDIVLDGVRRSLALTTPDPHLA